MRKALWIIGILAGLLFWGSDRSYEAEVVVSGVTIGKIEVRPLPSSPGEREGLPAPPEAPGLREKLCASRWVAFAPTNFDPIQGILPPEESLREDLRILREAGFDGLITYGADVLAPQLAQKAGFRAMIVGVWDPRSKEELARAQEAARSEIVLGFAVGNEGLWARYERDTLEAAVEELRESTGKPVTTTEEIEDYYGNRWLLELGDFVLPNVHPYWNGITDPHQAAAWTEEQFHRLAEMTAKPILLKEVGLPSAGDPNVSEQKQADYYRLLGERTLCFAYFEFADQPWKRWAPVEPHWGLFKKDRSPKLAAQQLMEVR